MTTAVEEALLQEAAGAFYSAQLREVLEALESSMGISESRRTTLRAAFDHYRDSVFTDDLHESASEEQFGGLIADLQYFQEHLAVEIDDLVQRVDERERDFNENEEARADHLLGQYKEWRQEDRAQDREVSEMFGSLPEEGE